MIAQQLSPRLLGCAGASTSTQLPKASKLKSSFSSYGRQVARTPKDSYLHGRVRLLTLSSKHSARRQSTCTEHRHQESRTAQCTEIVMPPNFSNSEWLRSRAEECRTIAETFKDQEARKRMMRVAKEYELLARVLEENKTKTGRQEPNELRPRNA